MRKANLMLAFCLITFLQVPAQNSSVSFGNNATHFSDREKRPFNFFNPEIVATKKVHRNYILVSVDGFYANNPTGQRSHTGDVYDRMIFTLKGNYALKSKNLLFGMGPAVRYRDEKIMIDSLLDFVGGNEAYFDVGLNSSAMYMFNTRKNIISLKLSYSVFNAGRNPLSFGIFYGWRGKK